MKLGTHLRGSICWQLPYPYYSEERNPHFHKIVARIKWDNAWKDFEHSYLTYSMQPINAIYFKRRGWGPCGACFLKADTHSNSKCQTGGRLRRGEEQRDAESVKDYSEFITDRRRLESPYFPFQRGGWEGARTTLAGNLLTTPNFRASDF